MKKVWDFADASFPLKWTSQRIKLGTPQIPCRGWEVKHPGNFQVVLKQYWEKLGENQRELNKFYNGPVDPKDPNSVLVQNDPQFLLDATESLTDLYVVVYQRKTWYRAVVLHSEKDPDLDIPSYKVYFLDYGEHRFVTVEQIRRIPQQLLRNFPAQAVKCALEFEGDLSHSGFHWTDAEANIFYEIMNKCHYLVQFIRYEIDNTGPNPMLWYCKVWLVRYDTTLGWRRREFVGQYDVATILLNEFQRISMEQTADKKTKNEEKNLEEMSLLRDSWDCLEECDVTGLENYPNTNVSLEDTDFLGVFPRLLNWTSDDDT